MRSHHSLHCTPIRLGTEHIILKTEGAIDYQGGLSESHSSGRIENPGEFKTARISFWGELLFDLNLGLTRVKSGILS